MGIKINQNILAIVTQRHLSRATDRLEQSFERLSSGERLNRSADDPAGMATSEGLRYDIQGLRQNQQNVSSAFSMIGTAESQLENLTNILQRSRELAVQAGNETLSSDNRQAIQNELDELIEELNRVAGSARYGDSVLLTGQINNMRVQTGVGAGDWLAVSLADYRTDVLGAWAGITSTTTPTPNPLMAGEVLINNVSIPSATSDSKSTFAATGSAEAKANAINQVESQTGVKAMAIPATQTGMATVQAMALDGAGRSLIINGVNIGAVNVLPNDSTGTLVARINSMNSQTGVTAAVDATGHLVLTGVDGRNVEIRTTGSMADELGLAATNSDVTLQLSGKIQLSSTYSFTVSDANLQLALGAASISVDPDVSRSLDHVNVGSADGATAALLSIDAALRQVTNGRSQLGSVSNRLEAVSEVLARQVEDLSSADSRIRDTDFAFESARLTQSQILQEAAMSMLAQANVTPRRALELLQG